MNQKEKGVSIHEIARRAGVHPSTVSRALNGSPLVKEETRQQICDLAANMGYIPDAVAKSLSSGTTSTIGVLVPEIASSFYGAIVDAIDAVTTPKGYTLLLSATRFDPETEVRQIRAMASKRVDALVACAPSDAAAEQLCALDSRIPVILCDPVCDSGALDRVYVEEARGIAQMVEYLLVRGYRDIGCIADSATHRRMDAFGDILEQMGQLQRPEWFLRAEGHGVESGYLGLKALAERKTMPRAIFAARDTIAIGIMRAAAELHLRIPDDLSIVGYDDIPIANYLSRTLTTIHQPAGEIGRRAAELLLQRLDGKPHAGGETIRLVPELVIREST